LAAAICFSVASFILQTQSLIRPASWLSNRKEKFPDPDAVIAGILNRQERNERTQIVAERLLEPAFCLHAGRRYEATAPFLPRAVAA
jgi:hypothetical protein